MKNTKIRLLLGTFLLSNIVPMQAVPEWASNFFGTVEKGIIIAERQIKKRAPTPVKNAVHGIRDGIRVVHEEMNHRGVNPILRDLFYYFTSVAVGTNVFFHDKVNLSTAIHFGAASTVIANILIPRYLGQNGDWQDFKEAVANRLARRRIERIRARERDPIRAALEELQLQESGRSRQVAQEEQKDICAICMNDEFNNPVTTSCNHTFCEKCLDAWKKQQNASPICPTCRQNL